MEALGFDRAGIDGINADVFWSELLRQHARDGIHRTLGSRVDGSGGRRGRTRDRTDIDNTAALIAEVFQGLLRREKQAEDIGIVLTMELFFRHRLQWLEAINAGVVNQDVQLAERFLRRGEEVFDVGPFRDVSFDRNGLSASLRDFVHHLVRAFRGAGVVHDNVRAFRGEMPRDVRADAFGGARYYGYFSCEFLCLHFLVSFLVSAELLVVRKDLGWGIPHRGRPAGEWC